LFLAEVNNGISLSGILGFQMQNELGWSEEERLNQIQTLEKYISSELAWQKRK
jgi:hypothetical protein